MATVVWTAIGFNWFGPGFNWTTRGNATTMSATAVKDSLAAICVAQARGSFNAEASLEELSGLSPWKQGEYVEKARWAKIPGRESAQTEIAELCAVRLRET